MPGGDHSTSQSSSFGSEDEEICPSADLKGSSSFVLFERAKPAQNQLNILAFLSSAECLCEQQEV